MARATISKAARSEIRPPQISRLRMSRPRSSVPSQCAAEGPALTAVDVLGVGGCGATEWSEDGRDDHDEEEDQPGDGPVLMEEPDPEPRAALGQFVALSSPVSGIWSGRRRGRWSSGVLQVVMASAHHDRRIFGLR